MKCVLLALTCAAFTSIVCHGQEPGRNYQHLKNYEAFIGTWEYDGLTLRAFGDVPEGTRIVARISWKWIFNKNVIEYNATYKIGDSTWGVKNLDGWDDEAGQVVIKGFSSFGKPQKGVVTFSANGKELTPMADSKAKPWAKFTATGHDSITVQIPVDGPKYMYKRAKQAK